VPFPIAVPIAGARRRRKQIAGEFGDTMQFASEILCKSMNSGRKKEFLSLWPLKENRLETVEGRKSTAARLMKL
jgi:hypothetical protein